MYDPNRPTVSRPPADRPVPSSGRVVDLVALREAVANDLVRSVVVDHDGGRDGMGEVRSLATLAQVLDTLTMCEAAELVTPTRVLRLVRTPALSVVIECGLQPEVLARIDSILPLALDATEPPAQPSPSGQNEWEFVS